jgi:hypothetical protein
MRLPHTHFRDSSLRRLSRLNRWLVAASVALTGVFAEAAARAFPGKSASKPAAQAKHARARAAHPGDSSESRHATAPKALRPPEQPPRATSEAAPPPEAPAGERSAPSDQGSSAEETAPEPEIASEGASETAPAQEAAPPVVSGGS